MLEIKNLAKTYIQSNGSSLKALQDLSLQIGDREFVALVGPSGCGKTTILKLIAGLEKPTSGEVIFDGEKVFFPDRQRGMIFQDFALFPWLSVENNIAFGPRLQKLAPDKISQIVGHYLALIDLKKFKNSFPAGLSGGMQQRVAIARTWANRPKMLLMDEPFGALDVFTRSKMQEFLAQLWEKEKNTVIFVTHDIEEAIFLADRIFLITAPPGRIKKEIKVDFSRPRTHELKLTDEFSLLQRQVHKLFESA